MPGERQSDREIGEATVSAFAKTFINRNDQYPIQFPTGTYITVHHELTDNLVAAHLQGYMTLGAYALDPNGWAKWICFDADDDKRWKELMRLAKNLSDVSVVPYLEPSRRGGHLWLFTPTIPGFQIRRFGKQLLEENEIDGIEIYPKQDRPGKGPGSLVRLPLGIHKMSGKRYHFVNLDGTPLAPTIRDQIRIFANPQRIPQAFIDQVLERAPKSANISPTPHFTLNPDTDGPVSERIKARISVFDFVSHYVELDQSGKGHCPFHDDEHKSFQVSQDGNYWNCYAGCGGGSIIDFWTKWRALHGQDDSFKATIADLADMILGPM